MGGAFTYDCELRLGLPGTGELEVDVASEVKSNKRFLTNIADDSRSHMGLNSVDSGRGNDHATKARIVGWPPIRSYRRNSLQPKKETAEDSPGVYVKVSLDGAPYLRKVDLSSLKGYSELLLAIETMFKITIGNYSESEGYAGSDYEPTYEDKDGDWMLVGDVPWVMFATSCKKLRIMRNAEAALFD